MERGNTIQTKQKIMAKRLKRQPVYGTKLMDESMGKNEWKIWLLAINKKWVMAKRLKRRTA